MVTMDIFRRVKNMLNNKHIEPDKNGDGGDDKTAEPVAEVVPQEMALTPTEQALPPVPQIGTPVEVVEVAGFNVPQSMVDAIAAECDKKYRERYEEALKRMQAGYDDHYRRLYERKLHAAKDETERAIEPRVKAETKTRIDRFMYEHENVLRSQKAKITEEIARRDQAEQALMMLVSDLFPDLDSWVAPGRFLKMLRFPLYEIDAVLVRYGQGIRVAVDVQDAPIPVTMGEGVTERRSMFKRVALVPADDSMPAIV